MIPPRPDCFSAGCGALGGSCKNERPCRNKQGDPGQPYAPLRADTIQMMTGLAISAPEVMADGFASGLGSPPEKLLEPDGKRVGNTLARRPAAKGGGSYSEQPPVDVLKSIY